MKGCGTWIAGGIVGFIGILGLIAASRAADGAFYYGGFLVFIASLVYIFRAIARHYDSLGGTAGH